MLPSPSKREETVLVLCWSFSTIGCCLQRGCLTEAVKIWYVSTSARVWFLAKKCQSMGELVLHSSRANDPPSELALWPTNSTPRNYSAIPQFVLKHPSHVPDITSTLETIYSYRIEIQVVRFIVSTPPRNTFSPGNYCRLGSSSLSSCFVFDGAHRKVDVAGPGGLFRRRNYERKR